MKYKVIAWIDGHWEDYDTFDTEAEADACLAKNFRRHMHIEKIDMEGGKK